ncbi:hypothetical protein HII31_03488, partial [Pseudocercospora fuligena]
MSQQYSAQDIHQLGRGYKAKTRGQQPSIPQSIQAPVVTAELQNQCISQRNQILQHATQTPETIEGEPLKSFLERISPIGLSLMNSRDFTSNHPSLYYLHPNHKIYFDNFPEPLTWDQHMQYSKQLAGENPAYRLELKGIDSDIDEGQGRATVHMEIEVFGLSGTERMLGVSSVEWER